MAGEDARLKAGLKSAEDELNLIKNQIQQTLLDIREHILDVTNPFNSVVPELLDDDEEMSIEDSGGVGGEAGADGEDGVSEGEGEGEEIEGEGEGEAEEDIESVEDAGADEVLMEDGDSVADEYEDVPEDEIIEDGGGSGGGGGLMDLLEDAADEEEAEEEESEGFELDDEEQMPEFEADIESEELTDPQLLEDALPEGELESSGDGVADAVAAALVADVDLLTMASLVRWTAVTRERLGANRLDILLDAYEMAGRLTPQMKNVVRALSALGEEDEDGIPVRDVVTAMVRMDGVINSEENRESNRLLGLLLEMDEDPLDHLAA